MNRSEVRSCIALMAGIGMVCWAACSNETSPAPPGGPDTTAPQPVLDLSLTYDSLATSLVFAWRAPRDDDRHARVDHYDIRYDDSFPFDWEHATRMDQTPPPLAPGTAQTASLEGPARGRDYYASIRAVDTAGNVSAAGAVAHARISGYSLDVTCVDVFTTSPVAGLDALVTVRAVNHVVTGADGRVVLSDLAAGTAGLALTTGASQPAYHSFTDSFDIHDDVSRVVPMIPFQQPQSALYPSMLALLKDGLFSPGGTRTIRRWYSYPVSFYARDFVNVNGLDYRTLLQQAAERWNTRLGFEMFAATGSDPTTGILVEFLPRSTMGTTNAVTEYSPDAEGYPQHDRIRVVDDMVDGERLYAILMHELGHTIPLVHLPAGFIMYGSQPLPTDITDDEVAIVKLLLALPNGTVLDHYDQAVPLP